MKVDLLKLKNNIEKIIQINENIEFKKEQLENLALFSEEDIPEDERIYSTIDYIDSTLYKQISSIDGVIPKK